MTGIARARTAAVDLLNRGLLTRLLPVAQLGPLRRPVMREDVLPRLGAPNPSPQRLRSLQGIMLALDANMIPPNLPSCRRNS